MAAVDSCCNAILFPGQGAQTVGMASCVREMPAVRDMFATAKTILGYDIEEIMMNGPAARLDETAVAQPALLIAGLAAYEKMRCENPSAASCCGCMAGLSLGEYTALVASGCMSFADAMAVVKTRAEAMQTASMAKRGCMMTVVNMDEEELTMLCAEAARKSCMTVQVCNMLFPKGLVVGGQPEAMEMLKEMLSTHKGVVMKELQVAGAFHTPMMQMACKPLEEALCRIKMVMPRVPVYSNVTGKMYCSVDEIRRCLVQQIVSPVKWQMCIEGMMTNGMTHFYDCGPRATIKTMIRRIDMDAWKNCMAVEV